MSISDLTISGANDLGGIVQIPIHKKEIKTDAKNIGFLLQKRMRVLTEQELHNLAMNIVGKTLEKEGYEFMGVNSTLKKNPQFVCLKEKELHFIVVRNVLFPQDPNRYDSKLMQKMKEHARQHEGRTYYAGVGLYNAVDQSLPVFLNEEYIVEYNGLIEI